MNSSFTKAEIHNYLIEQGFPFNNNKIPNASLLNHINNDRLTFARICEVLLQNNNNTIQWITYPIKMYT